MFLDLVLLSFNSIYCHEPPMGVPNVIKLVLGLHRGTVIHPLIRTAKIN